MSTGPTQAFWEEKFTSGHTPWDRGQASGQLGRWLSHGELQPCRVLVPGCGSGYEVVALAKAGFEVVAVDYAQAAVDRCRQALRQADCQAVVEQADLLQWQPQDRFDAIYEQTCLCAIHPDFWRDYADRLAQWLHADGRLFALFAQMLRPGAADGAILGPPYHCDINAMRALFTSRHWVWPKPPYERTSHPMGLSELAVVLLRGQTSAGSEDR